MHGTMSFKKHNVNLPVVFYLFYLRNYSPNLVMFGFECIYKIFYKFKFASDQFSLTSTLSTSKSSVVSFLFPP